MTLKEHEETYLALIESKNALIKILKSRDVEKINNELEKVKKELLTLRNDTTRFINLHFNINNLSIDEIIEYQNLISKLSELKSKGNSEVETCKN